jgi:translation initiation factor IF-1
MAVALRYGWCGDHASVTLVPPVYNCGSMTSTPPTGNAPVLEGTVVEALPHALFAVELSSGQRILARIDGTLQMRGTRVNPGDRVTVQLSPYDFNRGRITRRER